jgi:ligand-binding SRPBCC domain-containing protein
MKFYQLYREQFIDATLNEVWKFVSAPQNLKDITPEYMGFHITSENLPEEMYPGMIISYKVSPMLGIKLNWVTEITHVSDRKFFVDEQRLGPYRLWHHQHILEPMGDGVLMKDIVTYKPPYGVLGYIANSIFIRKQLEEIFDYRAIAIEKRFRFLETVL